MDREDSTYTLDKEQFLAICNGRNLREYVRSQTTDFDERLVRGSAAIMLLMFRQYPAGMTQEDAYVWLNSTLYTEMEDEEFQSEVKVAVSARVN